MDRLSALSNVQARLVHKTRGLNEPRGAWEVLTGRCRQISAAWGHTATLLVVLLRVPWLDSNVTIKGVHT